MDDDMTASEELQLVVFRLSGEEFALPITKVQEINHLVAITKLPQTPSFMEGIINLRGRIIPIIDLRKRFQIPSHENNENTRIVVVDINGNTVGIVVDAVTEVIRMPLSAVEPPPPSFVLDAKYLRGVGKYDNRLLILLDIDKVLTTQEEIQMQKLHGEQG